MPATSATSFAAVSVPQPGQLEQRPGVAADQLLELGIERLDVARKRRQAANEVAADAHLGGLLHSCQGAAQLLYTFVASLKARRLLVEARVEVVQVPAQAVMDPGALRHEVLAVVCEQRDLACWALEMGGGKIGLTQGRAARARASASIESDLP